MATAGPHTHVNGTNGIYTVSVNGSATVCNSMQHGGAPSGRQKLTRVDNWEPARIDGHDKQWYRMSEFAHRIQDHPPGR